MIDGRLWGEGGATRSLKIQYSRKSIVPNHSSQLREACKPFLSFFLSSLLFPYTLLSYLPFICGLSSVKKKILFVVCDVFAQIAGVIFLDQPSLWLRHLCVIDVVHQPTNQPLCFSQPRPSTSTPNLDLKICPLHHSILEMTRNKKRKHEGPDIVTVNDPSSPSEKEHKKSKVLTCSQSHITKVG